MTPRKSWLFSMAGQQEADGVRLLCQRDEGVVVMDVVHFAGMIGQIAVQEALQHADGQLAERTVEQHRAGLLARVPRHREATLGAGLALQRLPQRLRVAARHNAVDRLKDLRGIMDVLQLHERIACGMVGEVLTGMIALQLLIAGLCGGKGMVAVADGEHHGNALQALVLLADVCGIVRQAGIERSGFLAVDEPAADVAARPP